MPRSKFLFLFFTAPSSIDTWPTSRTRSSKVPRISSTGPSTITASRFCVSHITVYPTEDGENASAIITGKQLWYTHFFMTGLDIYALVRDTESEDDAFYLVSLIRMRTDGVGGMFGNLLKNQAVKSVLENVERYLTSSKAAIERYFQNEIRQDELRR